MPWRVVPYLPTSVCVFLCRFVVITFLCYGDKSVFSTLVRLSTAQYARILLYIYK